jgi:hypothetical protein
MYNFLPPMEVTRELLLADGESRQRQEASGNGNNLQMIIYGT